MGEAGNRVYGTVSAERQKAMSGLAFVRGLADGSLPLNTIAGTLGYAVSEAEEGRVVVAMVPTGAHLNPAGTVHGGLAATLLDSCMGLAIQSTLAAGIGQTTVEFKISLLRPITSETLSNWVTPRRSTVPRAQRSTPCTVCSPARRAVSSCTR